MFCIGIGGQRMVMMKEDDEEVDGMMFCIGIGGRGAGCIWVDWDALCCQLVLSCTAMHTLHTLLQVRLPCTLSYKLHFFLQVALRCTLYTLYNNLHCDAHFAISCTSSYKLLSDAHSTYCKLHCDALALSYKLLFFLQVAL